MKFRKRKKILKREKAALEKGEKSTLSQEKGHSPGKTDIKIFSASKYTPVYYALDFAHINYSEKDDYLVGLNIQAEERQPVTPENDLENWQEVISTADLSVRATNVLLKNFSSYDKFLASDADSLRDLRNCGRKTVRELIEFRNAIAQRKPFQPGAEVPIRPKTAEEALRLPPSEENIPFLPVFSSKPVVDFAVHDLHSDFYGAAPLKDFLFSVRTSKILRLLGLNTVGEVMLFPSGELLTQKNFGRKCLREVQDIIRSFILAGGILQLAAIENESGERLSGIDFSSYENLVASFARNCLKSKRNQAIVCSRLDFRGAMPTLEQLGERFGLTRERVRQILKRGNDLLRIKAHRILLSDVWDSITSITTKGGGVIRLEELAISIRDWFAWKCEPNAPALGQLISIWKPEKTYASVYDLFKIDTPCLTCDVPLEKLSQLDFDEHDCFHYEVISGALSLFCRDKCDKDIVNHFNKSFIEMIVSKSNKKFLFQDELVFKYDRWIIRYGEKLEDQIIHVLEKHGKSTQSVQTYTRPANPPKPVLDPAVIEQLTEVLSSHFTNGYRLNSLIEMARFRSFAAEDLDEEITLADEELKNYIAACGTTYDSKVYAVSAETKERIKELVDEYFSDGAQAIFFAEFYAKNENWLFEASVISEDMLIDILRRLFPKLSFTQTYFGYTDASVFAALEGEILRVWGDDVLLTYGQLAERLRYIPLQRIKSALGQNGDFIRSSVETFSHVSRIEITDEERQIIREAAVRECNARGYASITDLPFGEIEERNYELSITAVHNAVYRICLSDKFDKRGKIVARKGDVFDALTIMKEYCRTIDKCSLDDLLIYEKELTGEAHRRIPMEAGNIILVRIDKNIYVADRYVHFNADIIDEAIGVFVKNDYISLKSFTTFGAFPDCGQTWNLFLLESYCRRFSLKFRFDAPSVNSRNAGAVIRKSCGMDYTQIMTDAVANTDVPLKDAAVGKFLYESGYTGRSKTAKVNEIIDKAKAIRERRD